MLVPDAVDKRNRLFSIFVLIFFRVVQFVDIFDDINDVDRLFLQEACYLHQFLDRVGEVEKQVPDHPLAVLDPLRDHVFFFRIEKGHAADVFEVRPDDIVGPLRRETLHLTPFLRFLFRGGLYLFLDRIDDIYVGFGQEIEDILDVFG